MTPEIQANPPKIVQTTNFIFSICGKNKIVPWNFFKVFIWVELHMRLNFDQFFQKFTADPENFAANLEKVS